MKKLLTLSILLASLVCFSQFHGRDTDKEMLHQRVFDSLRMEYIRLSDVADLTYQHFRTSEDITMHKMDSLGKLVHGYNLNDPHFDPKKWESLLDKYWTQYNESQFKDQLMQTYSSSVQEYKAAISMALLYGGSLWHLRPIFKDFKWFNQVRLPQYRKMFDEHEKLNPDKTRHGDGW